MDIITNTFTDIQSQETVREIIGLNRNYIYLKLL
jgi:hypothetical protein